MRRVGLWLLLASAILLFAASRLDLPVSTSIAGPLAGIGLLSLGIGMLFEHLGVGHGRCPRCGRPASHGSALCATHRRALAHAGRIASEQRRRQSGLW